MRITLSNIEPTLAQRIREEDQKTTVAVQTGSPLPGSTPFHSAIRNRENSKYALRNFGGCGVPFIMLPFFLLWRRVSGLEIGTVPVLLITIVALAATYFLYHFYHRRIDRNAEAKLVSLGLSLVARTNEEQLYGDVVEELSKASGATEDAARSLLHEVNALMGSYRALEVDFTDSPQATENGSMEELKMESERTIAPQQQEVIGQILGSVHASLTGGKDTPHAVALGTGNLLETVNDLQNRSRAVKQAVEELVSVRAR